MDDRQKCLPGTDNTYTHRWKIEASDWDDLPDDVVGCATCGDCGLQQFVFRCEWQSSQSCTGKAICGDACLKCLEEEGDQR